LHRRRTRTVGLGRTDGRYFTFCAGFGLDAAVVRQVERARLRGRVSTPSLYIQKTMAQFLLEGERRAPGITLHRPDGSTTDGLAMAVVQNTAPWTYIGARPVNPCPDASFDTGLDVMGLTTLTLAATARAATRLLSRQPGEAGRDMVVLHDLTEFTLRAPQPLPFQVDGDYLGEMEKVTFASVPAAIRVFC
jgi:diacylglycerol kinase family enzyme